MSSKNDAIKNKANFHSNWKQYRWVIIVVVLLAVIVAFDLSPIGGNTRFYSKWVECGQKPVASDVSLNVGAHPPSYTIPPNIAVIRLSPTYFCTPLEAEQAGYSANSDRYEFPHLKTSQ